MSTHPPSIEVDLRHAILMIARALDYVGVDDFNHGHRVGYIAYECAKRLGWSRKRQEFIYLAGLLHDCGVSAIQEHGRLLSAMEPPGVEAHCIRGSEYLQDSIVLQSFAQVVRFHHTRWDELKKMKISRDEKEAAALIFLADRTDMLRATYVSDQHPEIVVLYESAISDTLNSEIDTLFNPIFVKAITELVLTDGFWYNIDQNFIEGIGQSFAASEIYKRPLSTAETIQLAKFLSRIVDAKSPFTHDHSERVARITVELASDFGLTRFEQDQVRIAGLLHDVGKLRVPDALLHKTGKLEDAEMAVMKRHVVDTMRALQRAFPSSDIPRWAANHHEKLDGTGYPYRLHDEQLDIQSRMIAVADIFQALAQDRPYRSRLTFAQIDDIMRPMADAGKIDPKVYDTLCARSAFYYDLATLAA